MGPKGWVILLCSLSLLIGMFYFTIPSSTLVYEKKHSATISSFRPTQNQQDMSSWGHVEVRLANGRPVMVELPINSALKLGDKLVVLDRKYSRGLARFTVIGVEDRK
jgi:hypothetical protein